ncbi:Polypeptide N-acetylgalactosaminyltransferase 5 [Pseudolycoriella hygida]|uniref:Polypeptide N-acetylgalactosaminyltransferase 5 n=1 Tax=Pseudolycoriella hygida TaxID=35572 RepID=A0A9Q0MR84_9DIPT|nr:Polypeptide N-acetylgalactosaminyltransferase 5 [Pseudolycoriella hygida]
MRMEFKKFGQIKSVPENKCADINFGNDNEKLALFDCHGKGGNQFFAFAKNQMIVTQNSEQCVGVTNDLIAVITVKCANQNESQLWIYFEGKKWMVHVASGHCMQANKTEVTLGKCDSDNVNFQWEINNS